MFFGGYIFLYQTQTCKFLVLPVACSLLATCLLYFAMGCTTLWAPLLATWVFPHENSTRYKDKTQRNGFLRLLFSKHTYKAIFNIFPNWFFLKGPLNREQLFNSYMSFFYFNAIHSDLNLFSYFNRKIELPGASGKLMDSNFFFRHKIDLPKVNAKLTSFSIF